jgi:hypothetical protein
MDEFLIVGTTQLGTPIYMSELSRQTLKDNGLDSASGGLFLYEASDMAGSVGIRVLAEVANEDAAYRLLEMLRV